MTNLHATMKNCAADALYDITEWDVETFREKMSDAAHDAAENATIYYSNCADIISRYDSEVSDADIADYISEKTYTAAQWQEAQHDYAYAVAVCVLQQAAGELVEEAETAADDLADLIEKEGGEDVTILCAASCPYGWAAHNYETDAGAMVWRNIEGSRAVAVQAGGIWLHAIWTPNA